MEMIGVIGAGDATDEQVRTAEAVGELIAQSGYALITGGLTGVMEGASRGAKNAGGTTVGIIPGNDSIEANPYLDIVIPSGMGDMRNMLIVRSAKGLIAVGGGYGTLSEIALSKKRKVPLVTINSWDISEDILRAKDAAEAMDILLKLIKK
ncbi:MAG: TIGR00725 family protein [Deltaproteobacteria bacterium]|nr:TIGR00725 family protein [Deltaproteobacteria bacterium]